MYIKDFESANKLLAKIDILGTIIQKSQNSFKEEI